MPGNIFNEGMRPLDTERRFADNCPGITSGARSARQPASHRQGAHAHGQVRMRLAHGEQPRMGQAAPPEREGFFHARYPFCLPAPVADACVVPPGMPRPTVPAPIVAAGVLRDRSSLRP